MLKDVLKGFLDLVFPRICLLCRTPLPAPHGKSPLCGRCRGSITYTRPPFCRRCSRPLTDVTEPLCGSCRKTAVDFDRAWSATVYDDTMRRLVHLFKYGNKTALRHTFGEILTDFVRLYHVPVHRFDVIMPAPLHRTRMRERGYNQARLLAETVAKEFDVPVDTRSLRRVRHTPNQARLSPKERWTNVDGAFRIEQINIINHKNILIIDDLLTTGATASSLARVLKQGGAAGVSLLTLSVTVRPHEDEHENPA